MTHHTLHLSKKSNPAAPTIAISKKPAMPNQWSASVGLAVTIRLKSGVALTGTVESVAANILSLTQATLRERDEVVTTPLTGKVITDVTNISFIVEGSL